MADRFSQDRLEAALVSVGEHLVFRSEAEVGVLELQQTPRQGGWRRVLVAAAILVAVVAVTLLVPPARTAVARWFGIGSTEIQILPAGETNSTDLPRLVDGLISIPASEAALILDGRLPDTSATGLGAPDNVYEMPEGGVLFAWLDEAATLWIQPKGIDGGRLLQKLIAAEQEVEEIDGLGDAALLIVGEHTLETPHRRVAAVSVLLWTNDGVEYRFESDLSRGAIVEFARSVS